MKTIRIGRSSKSTYIQRIQDALKEENKVLLTSIGNRIRTLVGIVYEFSDIEKMWNIRKTEQGALELQVILLRRSGEGNK